VRLSFFVLRRIVVIEKIERLEELEFIELIEKLKEPDEKRGCR